MTSWQQQILATYYKLIFSPPSQRWLKTTTESGADKWTWEQWKRGLNLSWDVLHHVKRWEKHTASVRWGNKHGTELLLWACVCEKYIKILSSKGPVVCEDAVSLPRMSVTLAPSWEIPIYVTVFDVYTEDVRKSQLTPMILFLVFINYVHSCNFINIRINVHEHIYDAFHCFISIISILPWAYSFFEEYVKHWQMVNYFLNYSITSM